MNMIEFLHDAFYEMEGEFAVITSDGEVMLPAASIPSELPDGATAVELLLVPANRVVGIPGVADSLATYRMVKGDKVVNVALLVEPVDPDSVPEYVETFEVPAGDGWVVEKAPGDFLTFDEIFFADNGVMQNDKERENDTAPVEMEVEDAIVVDEVAGPADAAGDAHGSTGAGDRPEDRVSDEVTELGDSIDPSGDTGERDGAAEASGPAAPEGGESTEGSTDNAADPQFMNDAEVLGTEVEGFADFLNRPATLMLGEMWGARDRRNTLDEHWNNTSMSWIQWINGGAGNKNTPTWGFSRHPVGKDKAGHCVVLGSSVGRARKAKAMSEMFAMGLDIDSGAKLDSVITKIEELGLFCLIYTSYNNGKRGLQLKRDDVLRKLQIKTDPTITQIRQYLRDFDKNRYEESFIAGCTIKSAKKQVKDGVVIELDTPPLEKFRLIFPLEESVKIIDLAETHEAALAVWEDKITGLAQNVLGVHFDTSCTDPSRLFYTARHPKDAEDWYAGVVMGKPLAFADVEPFKKSSYTSKREVNAFTMAGDADDDRPPQAYTPSGKSLNDWHYSAKDRFMMAELMETLCSDRVRHSGGEAQGHVHTECPFESEHTSEGGTGTMAINALDAQTDYWTWFCHHDACQGRHKLLMLEEALRQGWFDEEVLYDTSHGFLLEGEDDDEEEAAEEPEAVLEGDAYRTPVERAHDFNAESTQEDIEKFIKGLHREGVDLTVQANVTAALALVTNLSKMDIKGFWKALEEARRQRDKDRSKKEGDIEAKVAAVNEWDFEELHTYGSRRIHDANQETPSLFHYMEALCIIRENSEGHARMRFLDKDGFAHHLNSVARFVRVSGENKTQIGVSAPHDVVSHLFSGDYGRYPDLRGLVTTPTFTKSGSLLTKPGYDWSSKLYYKPDATLSVPEVRKVPTEEEVYRAKQLLIEEILADFPLGAMTRPEIVEHALNGEGVAAVTNMMALILLPFMREMVDGPTPGHLLTKPAPGTGASLLTDVFSIIATGQVTPALAMPGNKDEMSKTLTSVLSNGQNIVFFDNINHSVDSGELASAMTTPTYQARILGKSQTIEVDVRCSWVFTGNNVTLSSELVRRLIMIDLDARLENPEMRAGFKHDDIRGWAAEHRGDLVWACLTIIQNWVAQGMVHQKDTTLASFENWSGAIGGVLKAAGMGGFMGNREALKASSTDNDSDDFLLLLEVWWDFCGSKPIPTKGDNDKLQGLIELANAEDLSLPIRKETNSDGDRVYNSNGFGKYLGGFKGRVYTLEDGQKVTVVRDDKRTKRGYMWNLERVAEKPVGNVT